MFVKTSDNKSVSLGTQREGNFLFCVVELAQGCVKQLGAKEHLNQQDAWRARKLKLRDREKHAQQMTVKDSDSESVLRKCCFKSFFRFKKAVQLGPAQAAAAGAWCRVPAAANQGMVTPDPPSPASARLAVLPSGQAQWCFLPTTQSVILEALADCEGTFMSFASGEASEAEVQSARRYLGRSFWMVRLPPEVMKQLLETGGREVVFPAWLLATLGQELPKDGAAGAAEADHGAEQAESSSSSESKRVRKSPMQELMLGKLAYRLSSTVGIQDVIRTVLRMLVPDSLDLADSMNVSHKHVRVILLKLDALHSLSRRFVAPPGGRTRNATGLLRIARYISPDSSPQANYDYFCATEELLLYRSDELPRDDHGNVAPFKGFEHQRRSMLCTTIARGEGNTAAKASKMVRMIAVESGQSLFEEYRSEVRGFLSDQGTERGIASFPVRSCSDVRSIVGAQALQSEAVLQEFRGLPLLHSALQIPGTLHIVFNALEHALKQLDSWARF